MLFTTPKLVPSVVIIKFKGAFELQYFITVIKYEHLFIIDFARLSINVNLHYDW